MTHLVIYCIFCLPLNLNEKMVELRVGLNIWHVTRYMSYQSHDKNIFISLSLWLGLQVNWKSGLWVIDWQHFRRNVSQTVYSISVNSVLCKSWHWARIGLLISNLNVSFYATHQSEAECVTRQVCVGCVTRCVTQDVYHDKTTRQALWWWSIFIISKCIHFTTLHTQELHISAYQ